MAAPVKVKFEIQGARELDRAFDSIEKRVKKLAKAEERAARDSAAATKRRIQAERSAARATSTTALARGGGAYRTPGEVTASYRETERKAKAHANRMNKIRERSAIMAGKLAEKAANAEIRAAQKAAVATQKARASMAKGAVGAFGRAGRSTIGSITGLAGGMGATAGTMAIGHALIETAKLRERSALISNAARTREGGLTRLSGGQEVNTDFLTKYAQRKSVRYGLDPNDLLSGLQTITETAGGGAGLEKAFAENTMDDAIETAIAYGTSMEDLGATMAAAFNAGVKPGEEMSKLLQDLTASGKEGQIEMRNLAKELPMLMGTANLTEMTAGTSARRVTALAQIAAGTTGGKSEEARTAANRTITDIIGKAPLLRKAGIQTFNKKGQVRDVAELLPDIIDAAFTSSKKFDGAASPMEAFTKVFGVRAQKLGVQLIKKYQEGYKGTGPGREAVEAMIRDKSGATLGAGERDAALAVMQSTEATAVRKNFAAFKVEIGKLLPEFTKLLPALTKTTMGFAKLAAWVVENPFKGLGALFAAKLTSELASAAIPGLFSKAITGAMGASYGGTGAGAIGGSKALGAIGAGLAITAAAVAITAAGVTLIDKANDAGVKSGKNVFAASMGATSMLGRARRGELSQDELAQLGAHKSKLEKFSQRSDYGAVGEAAGDFGIMDAYTPFKTLFKLFSESAKESQGVTKESAAEDVAAINEALMSGAKAQKDAAAQLAKAATSLARSGAPPTRD